MRADLQSMLWPKGHRPDIWAIVDTARDQRAYWAITNSFLKTSCLFAGPLPQALEMAAPYLVNLDPDDKLTEFLGSHWGNSLCVFLQCNSPMEELRRHLRKFLTVSDHTGRKLLFRYYDPRILRVYLPTCNSMELDTVYGPIQSYFTESDDAAQLMQFQYQGRKLKTEKREFVASRSKTAVAVATGPTLVGSKLQSDNAVEILTEQEVLVIQKAAEIPVRPAVTLQGAGRGGVLRRSTSNLSVYRTAAAGRELPFAADECSLPTSNLEPDLTVYFAGTSPGEVTVFVETPAGTAEKTFQVVAASLITGLEEGQYKNGIVVGSAAGGIEQRRRIRVTWEAPAGFRRRLSLRGIRGPALRLFPSADAAEGHSLATPHLFEMKAEPVDFWIAGDALSTGLGDASLALGVEGTDAIADWCTVTVAAIGPITAEIPASPSKAAGVTAASPASATLGNQPLVLLSGVAKELRLRLEAKPAGIPIHWSVVRNSDDSEAVKAVSAAPLPTLSGTENDRAMSTNAAGTFVVKVSSLAADGDTWGGAQFSAPIVLVHAAVVENRTAIVTRHCGCSRDPVTNQWTLRSARDIMLLDGEEAPVRLNATVLLTGGGPDGKRGVEAIQAGWVNNIAGDNSGARYKGFPPYAIGYLQGAGKDAKPVNLEKGPLLDTSRNGGSGADSLMETSGQQRGADSPLGALIDVKAFTAPFTAWYGQDAAMRPIEQIWSYLECRSYLTIWSRQAPALAGVVLRTGWSFTGDYTISPTRAAKAVVPARIAAARVPALPQVTEASEAGAELYPPTTSTARCRLDAAGNRIVED